MKVNFEKHLVTIRKHTKKFKQERELPCHEYAAELVSGNADLEES